MVVVEICTENIADTLNAILAGADRIELCSNLSDDGLTPDSNLFMDALKLGHTYGIEIFPMVRSRSGNFVYTPAEKDVMMRDAVNFSRTGAPGIVVGGLTPDTRPDIPFISELCMRCREVNESLQITFHKAIDSVELIEGESFADIVSLLEPFCDRVLTSGAARTALDGAPQISSVVKRGKKPYPIAAGRIRSENVHDVVRMTGVHEVHSRSSEICSALGKQPRVPIS